MRILDLFSGAGGAAMGYHRAFPDAEIIGVDIVPQPRYPFNFVQADAMTYPLDGFDLIHASPPCQAYSVANNVHKKPHPDLLPATRDRLKAQRAPWVIENVPGAPMETFALVCGLALGLNVKRHRWFESSAVLMSTACPKNHPGDWLLVFGHSVMERGHVVRKTPAGHNTTHRRHTTVARGREAMGIDWMNRDELSEAIPPAYTEWIGRQFAWLADGDDLASAQFVRIANEPFDLVDQQVVDGVADFGDGSVAVDCDGECVSCHSHHADMPAQEVKRGVVA